MIQFRDVTKDFKGNVVLSDISMEIKDKELTVLIGPSGCGKTTTLKRLTRLFLAKATRSLNGCTKPHHRKSGKQWVLTY